MTLNQHEMTKASVNAFVVFSVFHLALRYPAAAQPADNIFLV